MSLFAPLAVPVEIRASKRRVFRLSRNVSESGMTLERPAPFEAGEPVTVTFTFTFSLADAAIEPLTVRAVVNRDERDQDAQDGDNAEGGRLLSFLAPPAEARHLIGRYVSDRLGLPSAGRIR